MHTTETTSILNAQRLEEILVDCLFKDGEPTDSAVTAQAVTLDLSFHPGRLANHKAEILDMLNELPADFHDEAGGGMSYMHAGKTKYGDQWAEHPTIDKLLVLGIATEQAQILLPRDLWHALPGQMPYFSITSKPRVQFDVNQVFESPQQVVDMINAHSAMFEDRLEIFCEVVCAHIRKGDGDFAGKLIQLLEFIKPQV